MLLASPQSQTIHILEDFLGPWSEWEFKCPSYHFNRSIALPELHGHKLVYSLYTEIYEKFRCVPEDVKRITELKGSVLINCFARVNGLYGPCTF